jgi:hypothetical protein
VCACVRVCVRVRGCVCVCDAAVEESAAIAMVAQRQKGRTQGSSLYSMHRAVDGATGLPRLGARKWMTSGQQGCSKAGRRVLSIPIARHHLKQRAARVSGWQGRQQWLHKPPRTPAKVRSRGTGNLGASCGVRSQAPEKCENHNFHTFPQKKLISSPPQAGRD